MDRLNFEDDNRKAKKNYMDQYFDKLHSSGDPLFDSVFNEFLGFINKSKRNIGLLSKKRTVQSIYKNNFESDLVSANRLYSFATKIVNMKPNKYYLDMVFTIISIFEMFRHDLLIEIVKAQLPNYIPVDQDFKLSDYFPNAVVHLTPDILMQNKTSGKFLVVEIKVTVESDLIKYKKKYKDHVGDTDVLVINYNFSGFTQEGDVRIDLEGLKQHTYFETLNDHIEMCSLLRGRYKEIPEYEYFSNHNDDKLVDETIIYGFKNKVLSHKNYSKFVSVFGTQWSNVLEDMEKVSLIDNPEYTKELFDNAENDCAEYCSKNLHEFEDMFESNIKNKLYSQTKMTIENIPELQDRNALKTHTFTNKYRPSIYFPYIPSFEIKVPRKDFYLDVFKNLKTMNPDAYTLSVFKLISDLFTDDLLEYLIIKNKEDSKRVFPLKFCDIDVYKNNAFGFNNDHSASMRKNICGFDKPKPNKPEEECKLKCLSFIDKEKDIRPADIQFKKINTIAYNNQSYLRDLVEPDNDYCENIKLENFLKTKTFDFLFNQHSIVKNLIGLNKINNKKFRLIQTNDPCTLVIMLPNADVVVGAPIRFFTLSIIKNDDNSKEIIDFNKKMGICHDYIYNNKYIIMLTKVVSLDSARLKMLSNSFAKYSQLITYYENISSGSTKDIEFLCMLMCNMVTLQSLSITENFKNIMMVCLATFSNPDELIEDKLECKPSSFAHIYLMQRMFSAISESEVQRVKIIQSLKQTKVSDDGKELKDTGFSNMEELTLPISKIKTRNPKEVLQESYLLFYIGNKGLHGSPQEVLNLYHTPIQFQREFQDCMKKYGCMVQEDHKEPSVGFSFEAMRLSSRLTYSKIKSQHQEVRNSIKKELALDQSILLKPQFSSTKSMVSETTDTKPIKHLKDVKNLVTLENYIKNQTIDNPEEFCNRVNKRINELNTENSHKSKVKTIVLGEEIDIPTEKNKIPEVCIKYIRKHAFIIFKNMKKFAKPCDMDVMNQYSAKVFDAVIKESELSGNKTLREFYESNYLDSHDIVIRIFYKDQRSFNDREIYTGNLACRLSLFPIETTFKSINSFIPQEAISIAGEKKHKKMYEQRFDMLKKRKNYNVGNIYSSDIFSVSCDASKWSARDIMHKFAIAISNNGFLTIEEKWFLLYLLVNYSVKYIVLTEDALYNCIRFHKEGSERKIYEELTEDFDKNFQVVISNWLQGNFNSLSSFVHCNAAHLTGVMLDVINKKYDMNNYMDFLVHSDDSCYDFLIMRKNKMIDPKDYGTFLYTLIQWSTRKHCIVINRKKTYISNFYKEFISTLIIGNELFYFYMSDLLPISSDVTYDSPMDDLSSFSGYINNAFAHATPLPILTNTILLINHLVLSTYNLNASNSKSPYKALIGSDNKLADVPIQILPRYKIPTKFAGLIPYSAGDSLKILIRIISVLDMSMDRNSEVPLCDLFTLDVIKRYLEEEPREDYKNYIKMCLLSSNEDYLCKNQDDPYTLNDVDSSKVNFLSVIPSTKSTKPKPMYTYKKYAADKDYYRLQEIMNPMWVVSDPDNHDDAKDKLISNYSNRKFVDSLIFSRPQIAFARRLITSNAKIYRYNLSDDENLMTINDIYDKLKSDTNAFSMTPEKLLNYLTLNLFTDQRISSALHVFYAKERLMVTSRSSCNYKIIIPRNIYTPEHGRYSNTVLIKDIIVNPKIETIDGIDQKTDTLISIAESLLLKDNIRSYEYPEDIDDNFRNYFDSKLKVVDDYNDCLIKPVNIDKAFDMRIYKIKVKFQGLMIKYFNDTYKKDDYKIDYITPRSIITTINAYMLRDKVTSKLYIGTRTVHELNDYLLDRYGMYDDKNYIVHFRMNHKLAVTNNNLHYKMNLDKRYNDDMLCLSYINKSVDSDTWDDIVQNGQLYGQRVHTYLNNTSNRQNDIHKCIFLKSIDRCSDNMLITSMVNTNYIMNHWVIPTGSNSFYQIVRYMKSGYVLEVSVLKVVDYTVTMKYYQPSIPSTTRKVNKMSILESLIQRFRTDFKDILPHIKTNRLDETDHSVYINGLNVSLRYDNTSRVLCNVRNFYYNKVDVINLRDENHTFRLVFHTSSRSTVEFDVSNRNYIDTVKLFEMITKFRNLENYNAIVSQTQILKKDVRLLPSEFLYLEPEIIKEALESRPNYLRVTNMEEDSISTLYMLGNSLPDDGSVVIKAIKKMTDCLFLMAIENYPDKYDKTVDAAKSIDKIIKRVVIAPDINKYILEHFQYEEAPYINLFSHCLEIQGISYGEFILIYLHYVFKMYIQLEVSDTLGLLDDLE
uniref:RNA-directed RNA polymerase L n=1 Tax=Emaravirus tritici TaxID=1980428 RepID=A0A7T8CZZ0_9VIRU|nr:P1 RNA-dependent RNA polymerase [Emaravirus tritici]